LLNHEATAVLLDKRSLFSMVLKDSE
jgi:hypothetical protein